MSKILIVEDEEAIADLERDYLELSGFTVEVANDGDIGLQKALNEDYDLLILDLMLPGTDGFDICRQVRDVKNTPIVMVSAKKDDIDKIRGLGLGADDYMTKPFSPSELVARVKAHLARYDRLTGSAAEKNKVIEIRGLKIDTTARRVGERGRTYIYDKRVRPADIPCEPSEPRIFERRVIPGDLGYGVHRGYRNGNGAYQEDP